MQIMRALRRLFYGRPLYNLPDDPYIRAFVDNLPKKLKEGQAIDLVPHLKRHGWSYLDAGLYACVYLSPCGRYVVRISKPDVRDAKCAYARLCMLQEEENPYLPRIYAYLPFGKHTAVMVCEALKPVTEENDQELDDLLGAFSDLWFGRTLIADLDLVLAVTLIRTAAKSWGVPDLVDCDSNIMLRGTQLVLNDPLM